MSINTIPAWVIERQQFLDQIADACVQNQIDQFIISPGSRSAPLTLAFSRHPDIQCRVVYDERSAAYIALGMAQQLGRPVGLVCTSGTAALNYAPAVTEAFYQQVPLLVFTADRPPEWIDQQDNQAIHQQGLYEPHCRGAYQLPVDLSHPDAQWYVMRLIAEAMNNLTSPVSGPVHVNVPLREPLYVPADRMPVENASYKQIHVPANATQLTNEVWDDLLAAWQSAKRKLIIGGVNHPNPALIKALSQLSEQRDVAVIGEITTNIYPDGTQIYHADAILGTQDTALQEAIRSELIITFGGPVISKYLKLFLRKYPPQQQWHIGLGGGGVGHVEAAADTFQTLTHVIPMSASQFFSELLSRQNLPSEHKAAIDDYAHDYAQNWQTQEQRVTQAIEQFLADAPYGEFKAIHHVMSAMPSGSHLQIGNSMPIRYANFIGHITERSLGRVDANRGTSGIDGCVSTTVGASIAQEIISAQNGSDTQLTTLLVGDLSFFYDRNGLWHQYLPSSLRIVILNNYGGGIFDLIAGPNQLAEQERETYFLTPQRLNAKHTALDHGCEYRFCNDEASLATALDGFFDLSSQPRILEIETDMAVNGAVFEAFKALVR
ncbi:MAG: 2-succinyl-5-enolpyruvyl-6-hydroxy-3-cyclohexene-1-carboxylic-acid synthase [Chloroflexota bacterium]